METRQTLLKKRSHNIASFIGSGINGNAIAQQDLTWHTKRTMIASFIGSGINGNPLSQTRYAVVLQIASFIGSGINGNKVETEGGRVYSTGISLLLQEVELMETVNEASNSTSLTEIASFIGSGINGNTPEQLYHEVPLWKLSLLLQEVELMETQQKSKQWQRQKKKNRFFYRKWN